MSVTLAWYLVDHLRVAKSENCKKRNDTLTFQLQQNKYSAFSFTFGLMGRAGGTFNSPPVRVVNVSGNFNDLRTMRSETEIKNLILDFAKRDDRVRAVLLNGSLSIN